MKLGSYNIYANKIITSAGSPVKMVYQFYLQYGHIQKEYKGTF